MAWREGRQKKSYPNSVRSPLPRPSPGGRGSRLPARRHRLLRGEALESRTLLALTPQLLADINPTPVGFDIAGPPAVMGGLLYFSGAAGDRNFELWKSDGTTAGTVLVRDLDD